MKKKWTTFDYVFWGVIMVIACLTGAIGGYIFGNSLNPGTGRVDSVKLMESLSDPADIDFEAGIKALGDKNNPYPKYGLALGAGIVVIVIMYRSGQKKRYHRKGEEHGSARWGNKAEKRSIADVNDIYNNFILAKDIYLVMDRGQREMNIPAARKKAQKERVKQALHDYKMEHDPDYANRYRIKEADRKRKEEKTKTKNKAEKNIKKPDENSLRPLGAKDFKKQIKEQLAYEEPQKLPANEDKKSDIKSMLNLNIIIYGGSGSGKSRFVVKPNLLQCNCSFVVTDPSGELLIACGKMLETHGYKVKAFNLMDMKHSSNYNPFHYIYDWNGNFVEDKLIQMIEVFMLNTKEEGASGGEQFWNDSTKLLLSAVCFLLVEKCPIEDQNFANVLRIIRMAHPDDEKRDELSPFDALFEEWRIESPNSLAVQYYDEFQQAAGKTMQSILISTTVRLQHFKLDNLKNLTFTDNIELEKLGDEKTALFIIIPSTDKTYNFLAAMMYSQLFDTLCRRASEKYEYRGMKLPVHVRFILDEFANVGKIPNFENVVATIRKFEISVTIILQNLSQLKNMYEKAWGDIVGNCDSTIFLGNKDQTTNEFMVKDLGKETIDLMSINKTKSRQGSTSYNDSIIGRELLTADELSRLDNAQEIVLLRGYPPFKTYKHDLITHPRYKELGMERDSPPDCVFPLNLIFTEREVPITSTVSDVTAESLTDFEDITFDFFDEQNDNEEAFEYTEEAKTMLDGAEVTGYTYIPNGFNGISENMPIE